MVIVNTRGTQRFFKAKGNANTLENAPYPPRAYVQTVTHERCFPMIETPRGTWIRLDGYHFDVRICEDWLTDIGYLVVSKADSYAPR